MNTVIRTTIGLSNLGKRFRLAAAAVIVPALLLNPGCSLKKYAIGKIGDSLASGNSVYETDEDIVLVGEALPFGLKLMESLLQETPKHRGLLLTAARGFVLYSYGYVDYEAEIIADEDFDRAQRLRTRARKLYLRALGYGLRGLEVSYPGLGERLLVNPEEAVRVFQAKRKQKDVPLIYWTAAALGLAVSVSRSDSMMLARIPEVEALIERAIEMDETFDNGALHEFMVTLAGAKPGAPDPDKIRRHYDRALEISGGASAGLHLAFAESVSVSTQDRAEFESLIQKALAVDPDEEPAKRLVNLLAHRRAKWLLTRIDDLFLMDEGSAESAGDEL